MFNRLFKSENNYKAIYTPGYRYTEYGDHDNNYTDYLRTPEAQPYFSSRSE